MKAASFSSHHLIWHVAFILLLAGRTISLGADDDDLAKKFVSPPASAAPQTWWHWVNGNISKEGITADLEAMKRIGLGGATIVNLGYFQPGNVPFMSDSWRDMVRHAVKESARLGLKVGVENCAGWSSSGGPWVTPEYGMQMVSISETQVKGPGPFSGTLPQPTTRVGLYRDIAVLAYPTPAIEAVHMADFAPKVISNDPHFDGTQFLKHDGKAFLPVPTRENSPYIQFEFAQPYQVRTMALLPAQKCNGDIQASDNGQTFRTVRHFNFDPSGRGIQDYEIPATTARFFRIVFREEPRPSSSRFGIQQLDLRPAPAVDNFRGKSDCFREENIPPASTAEVPAEMTIDPAQVINLTDHLGPNGQLTWTAPEGNWTVLRVGYTPTGIKNHPAPKEGEGLEVDKLSRAALKIHWDNMMAKVIADSGPLAGGTLNHTLIDSYEVGSENWTPGMEAEFKKRQGYDLIPYLPVLAGHVVGGVEQSDRVLWDFRRTIADLFAENYFDYMGDLAHQSGLQLSTETYGDGPFDNLLSGRNSDVPMVEFWPPSSGSIGLKEGPSISHVYGKTLAGAESFTADASHTQQYPESLKALGDFAFSCGVNHMSFHRYAHQPWLNRVPGMTAGPWGSNLERTNTWWEQGWAWILYLTRCQYLLQQGHFVADALVLGPEGSPNGFPRADVPAGHDWDGCNDDVVLHRLTVQNGKLTLPDGMSYRVLVLPQSANMTPELLGKLQQLANSGATIIGPKPVKSPSLRGYPQCDQEVSQMADELWNSGKISTRPLDQAFASMALSPDFECSDSGASLRYIHRATDKADIYFVSNQRSAYEDADCFFRVTGKIPELWHPDTGVIEKAPLYAEESGRVRLPVRLDPIGSVFVIFREKSASTDHPISLSATHAPTAAPKENQLEIQHAVFGSPTDPKASADVTAKLTALIKNGHLYLTATTRELGGDPAPMVVKQLQVQYVLNGQPGTTTVREGQQLDLPVVEGPPFADAKLTRGTDGAIALEAWQPGTYDITTAQGKNTRMQISEVPPALKLEGPWQITFPPNWGAPAKATFDKLISWSDATDGGIQHFSGTATYAKTFSVPASLTGHDHRLYLDLGQVAIIAEIKLNGKDLGIVWKPPFCVDATNAIRPGKNALEIRVTNLWVNRLIGDEQLPPDCDWNGINHKGDGDGIKAWPQWLLEGKPSPTGRFTFTTWRHWYKDDPLLTSGLLGPVLLRPSVRQTVP